MDRFGELCCFQWEQERFGLKDGILVSFWSSSFQNSYWTGSVYQTVSQHPRLGVLIVRRPSPPFGCLHLHLSSSNLFLAPWLVAPSSLSFADHPSCRFSPPLYISLSNYLLIPSLHPSLTAQTVSTTISSTKKADMEALQTKVREKSMNKSVCKVEARVVGKGFPFWTVHVAPRFNQRKACV